jgi:glycosyltransferase involved in cell wall biosynthesis
MALALHDVSQQPLRILGVGNVRSINFIRWAQRLAERGHEVVVTGDRPVERAEDLAGVKVVPLRLVSRLAKVRRASAVVYPWSVRQAADRQKIDIVHAHQLFPFGVAVATAGIHPFVLSPWGTDILVQARSGPRAGKARRAIEAADSLVLNSAANEQACLDLGARPESIRHIIWYAELDNFGPDRGDPAFRGNLGWPDDALVVLSPRALRADTNIDVVVRAFAAVAEKEPRARLVLAARRTPLRAELEALVEELGLAESVAFVRAEIPELPALYASADVAVSLARSDSTPASLLEAMASGLPAVCGIAPSIEEWVGQGDGAELVPCEDDGAVAAALLGLLRDPDRRRAYGERNARVVREQIGDPGLALEQLYRELIDA